MPCGRDSAASQGRGRCEDSAPPGNYTHGVRLKIHRSLALPLGGALHLLMSARAGFRPSRTLALGLVGCAGHAGAAGDQVCSTVGSAPKSDLPHVTASGASATQVADALDAIFAAQAPPVAVGQVYALSSLTCVDVEVPDGATGYECSLELQTDGGQPISVHENAPSALAQSLFGALTAAGSSSCVDPHGVRVMLQNVAVSPAEVQFDDATNFRSIPTPNVVVEGADGQAVMMAFAQAGIDDCDPTRSVFIICNSFGGTPSCGYQWESFQRVGSSELVPGCGPSGTITQGASLDAASSNAIWQALLSAASAAHFQPMSGTIEQTTVVNARYFSWDGSRLGFTLVTGNAAPPSPAADAGEGG